MASTGPLRLIQAASLPGLAGEGTAMVVMMISSRHGPRTAGRARAQERKIDRLYARRQNVPLAARRFRPRRPVCAGTALSADAILLQIIVGVVRAQRLDLRQAAGLLQQGQIGFPVG